MSPSIPVQALPPAPVTSPAIAPVAVNELDKILIQDLLTERARIRTAIHTDIRVVGVGVVALVGVAWNAKFAIPVNDKIEDAILRSASWVLVLTSLVVLSSLFVLYLSALLRQLKSVNSNLAARLKTYDEFLDEDIMVGWARAGVLYSFLFLALTLLCLGGISKYNQTLEKLQLQHKISEPNSPSSQMPATPAFTGSKSKTPK